MVVGVGPISADTAKWIASNIEAYGEPLAPLDAQTWNRSICVWMEGYWDILVDLSTKTDPVSDLTLHANLYERGSGLELEVYGVYVP